MRSERVLVAAVYSHIDSYPPSLNAIYHLSKIFDRIIIVERDYGSSSWVFPSNVQVISCGPLVSLNSTKNLFFVRKLEGYFRFALCLRKILKREKPEVVLVYDGVALALSYFMSIPVNSKLWYHNHDVIHLSEIGKYSFQRFLKRCENKQIKEVDIFSLPTESRLQYFPKISDKTKTIVLPNYPSQFGYGSFFKQKKFEGDELRIIHQGAFEPANFDGLLSAFYNLKFSFPVTFSIAGPSVENCERKISQLSINQSSKNRAVPLGRVPYNKLPLVTRDHHIGLALYSDHNLMVKTVSTASNKIFEYISLGLPVIFTDREDFRKLFGHYSWAYFVSLDYANLEQVMLRIVQNYDILSADARRTFLEERNFEIEFEKIIKLLER